MPLRCYHHLRCHQEGRRELHQPGQGRGRGPHRASKAETVVPDGLTTEEVESSVVELGDITPDETKDFDVVVVGAGAAGVPAAGWAAELGGHVACCRSRASW